MSNSNQSTSLALADSGQFEHIQRVAKCYAESQLVPTVFQKNVPNIVVALEMAQRVGASPLMVMQNLNIIHGKPSWSAQFIIAAINSCGKFSPLRYVLKDHGQAEFQGIKLAKNLTCVAWAFELTPSGQLTDVKLESPEVTMEMAIAEGWYQKAGSKWKTMPEVMLRYRCATLFGRMYSPEILMGLKTEQEVIDIDATIVDPIRPTGATLTEAGAIAKDTAAASNTSAATSEAEPVRKRKPKGVSAPEAVDITATTAIEKPAEASVSNLKTEVAQESKPAEQAPAPNESAKPGDPAKPTAPAATTVRIEVEEVTERPTATGSIIELIVSGGHKGTIYYKGKLADLDPGELLDAVLDKRVDPKNAANVKWLLVSFTKVSPV